MSGETPAYLGIVREAKRPGGWTPPGPMPEGPGSRADLWPGEGEDLCFLTGAWRIFQRQKGHRYSIDDVATAWYALQRVRGRDVRQALDLGCGIGSVLMMVAWGLPDVKMVGVEAQALSFGLAKRSLAYNGIASRVEVRHGDLRDTEMVPEGPVFDLVTGTPPYIPLGHGSVSKKEQCGPCRFEFRGGIEDYCDAAKRLLSPEGQFVVCHAASQTARVETAATRSGLTIVSRRDVVPREGRQALFSVYAMVHSEAKPESEGPLTVEPPLLIRSEDGTRTADYLALRADMGMPP